MARKSASAVNEELKRRLEEIEILKEQALRRGLAFASPSEEELTKKIRGESGNSPYFYGQSWTSGTVAGTPAFYQGAFANPDPAGHYGVVTIFFGLANIAGNISQGFDARDPAWPYVSSQGVYLATGGTGTATFNYTVPNVSRGTYLGNAVLWEANYFDVGKYFDRAYFDITLQ